MKKVRVDILLSPEIHRALLARKDRTGRSLSGQIEEAVKTLSGGGGVKRL